MYYVDVDGYTVCYTNAEYDDFVAKVKECFDESKDFTPSNGQGTYYIPFYEGKYFDIEEATEDEFLKWEGKC